MKVSIAMCTYNGGRFLQEQLDTILTQVKQPYELMVCDDGSNDETLAILDTFRQKAGFPVVVHKNPINLGSTKNFEQAIQLCTGDVIALCDQDDRWFPEKLSVMCEALQAEPEVAGVFSDAKLIDEKGQLVAGSLWERAQFTPAKQAAFSREHAPLYLSSRDTVTGAAFMFRTSFVQQVTPISSYWVHDGWIALVLASSAQLRPLPTPLMQYRIHGQQQVGLRVITWRDKLKTKKDEALAAHLLLEKRHSAMADRLDELGADARISAALRARARFLRLRVLALQQSLPIRLWSITKLLPGYFRYQQGLASYGRDLLH